LDDLIYWHLLHTTRDYRQLQRYRYFTHFTVHRCTHIRILSLHYSYPGNGLITVSLSLQITHEVSLHRQILFLQLFCNCKFWRLDSVQFLCYQAHILAGWRLETRLCAATASFGNLPYNHFALATQKILPLCCWEGVFTAPLHSNGSYSIVACVFIDAGMCLPSHCLAMNVCSTFAIPAVGRHVNNKVSPHIFNYSDSVAESKWNKLISVHFESCVIYN
jgi:hypothetical protein